MLVRDLMTSPAVTIGTGDEVADAARLLDRLGHTPLPVVDHDLRVLELMRESILKGPPVLLHGLVVGMISRRDIVRASPHGDLDAGNALELSRV
jgi:CBS domain-containing protein